MNKTQKDHIIDRITKIGRIAYSRLEADPKRWDVKPMTQQQIYNGLKNGKLKLKSFDDCINKNRWSDGFENLDDCVLLTKDERKGKQSAWYVKETKKLTIDAENLKDRIILGDAKEALAMLNEFQIRHGVDITDEEV